MHKTTRKKQIDSVYFWALLYLCIYGRNVMVERKTHTLSKQERLKGKKQVQELFAKNESFSCYPIRVLYTTSKNDTKVLFSVPKKRFKHVVDRNRIKRLMREAYRLNKHLLQKACFHIAFVSICNTVPKFDFVQKKMCEALELLAKKQ